jgi:hypothetical protein
MTVRNVGYGQTTTSTYQTLSGLIAEFAPEKFQVTTNLRSAFLASGALEEEECEGEELVFDVEVGSNPTTSFIGDFGRRPVGQTPTPAKARVQPANITAVLTLGQTASLTKLSTKDLARTFDSKLDNVAKDVARFKCRALFNNAVNPQAAATWSGTAADSTVTVNFLDVSMFKPFAAYDFCDLSSGFAYVVRATAVTPAAVGANSANIAGSVSFINDVPNPATGSVVALTDTTVATGDTFRLRGSTLGFGGSNAVISGQPYISFDDIAGSGAGSAIIGVDPATTPGWVGQTIAVAAAYSQEAALQFAARVDQYGGENFTHAIMSPQLAAAHAIASGQSGAANGIAAANIASRAMQLDRTMDKYANTLGGEDFGGMGSGLTLSGRPVIVDTNPVATTLILHNKRKCKLAVWKRMGPDEEAGDSVLLSRTFFAKETYFSCSENLYPVNRSCIGTMTGFTNL